MSVTPRGMSIQEAYREYKNGAFLVNRTYQRKLVWALGEKRQLIDSILHGYPIPLILLATKSLADGSKQFEILDGMQRLNALFAFVENKFCLYDKYFDVQQLSRAKQHAEDGDFAVVVDSEQLLDQNQCANFLDYTLAVTEFPASDENAVNEVFRRINAYGRQLSRQEQRQAGVVSPFATMIRQLSAEIRGDVSTEYLNLAQMPEISIDVDGEQVDYGITADETFWCKQGILRRNQLRESEDEQVLADIAISILEEKPFAFSREGLDKYYDPNDKAHSSLNTKLSIYGVDALKHDIVAVISILRESIESVDNSLNALRRIVNVATNSNPIKTHFYSLFMAFYELCIQEQKSVIDSTGIMRAINNLHSRLTIARGSTRSEGRQGNINTTKGLIQPFFAQINPPPFQQGSGLAIRFENALRRSHIETSAFECKQGLLSLDAKREENSDLLDTVVNTICGIANIGPNSHGALFLGVADKEADKLRIESIDSMRAREIGSRYVVGIDRELGHMHLSLEDYKRRIVEFISNSGLSEPLKTAVLSNIDCISYRDLSVICIWIPKQSTVSHINDSLYKREGSSTLLVEGFTLIQAVASQFAK